MKVLFVLPEFAPVTGGGICTYYQNLLRNNAHWESTILQGSAFDMRNAVSSFGDSPIHYLKKDLFEKYKTRFGYFSIFPEIQSHLAAAWALHEQAQTLGSEFDLVVCTDWGLGFVPWTIKKTLPVIVHLHGSIGQIAQHEPRPGMELWSKLYIGIESQLLGYTDALVTHSKQNVEFWKERLSPAGNFSLIPPVIEQVEYSTNNGNSSEEMIGLVVGRIQQWKGAVQLCEAVKMVIHLDNFKIYWIGRDTLLQSENCTMDAFLTKTYPEIWRKVIIPVGELDHDAIESYYDLADFTLVPSSWDMFNLAAVEHLNHKKPLICSSGAGVSEYLTKSNGITIYDNSVEGLAAALKNYIGLTKQDLKELGVQANADTKELFKGPYIAEEHRLVMEGCIQKGSLKVNLDKTFEWLVPDAENYSGSKDALSRHWTFKELTEIYAKRVYQKLQLWKQKKL